jgi:mannose-6-phosphate isomerase
MALPGERGRGLLALAGKVNAFVKAHLVDALHGGVFDAHPITAREKRQNPLMHLLEAYLALERAAPGCGYLEDAAGLIALFRDRLFRADPGVLLEYFAEDWSAHPDGARADVFEPGHHFEWVWLLRELPATVGRRARPVAGPAVRRGPAARPRSGRLLYDEVGADWAVRKRSRRLWPHTEAIKAAAARHADGDADALPFARSMVQGLFAHFLDKPFPGGWADHVDEAHVPLIDYVPASSLYHLFFAAAEAAHALPASGAAIVDHQQRTP